MIFLYLEFIVRLNYDNSIAKLSYCEREILVRLIEESISVRGWDVMEE